MDIDGLAQALFGSKRAETQEVSTDGTTRTYTGVALTDSEDGTVIIDLGGDVTLPDDLYDEGGNVVAEWDGVGVEMPTSPQVSAGDDVIVTLMEGLLRRRPWLRRPLAAATACVRLSTPRRPSRTRHRRWPRRSTSTSLPTPTAFT